MNKKDKENAERIAKTIGIFTGKISPPKPINFELLKEVSLNLKKALKNPKHDLSKITEKLIKSF